MIWAIVFAGLAAFYAVDAYRSYKSGTISFMPVRRKGASRSTGNPVTYDRNKNPRSFWFGIACEILAVLVLAFFAVNQFANRDAAPNTIHADE